MKSGDPLNAGILDLSGHQHVQPPLIDVGGNGNLRDGKRRLAHHIQRLFQKVRTHAPILKLLSRSCQGQPPDHGHQTGSIFPAAAGSFVGMESIADIFAHNLVTLLKMEGWSDAELARRSGVSNRAIGMYRKGEHVPSIDAVEKIAQAFGYPAWELLHPHFDPQKMRDKKFAAVCCAYLSATDTEQRILSDQAAYILTHHPESCSRKAR